MSARAAKHAKVKALTACAKAESRYVVALTQIMQGVHRGVMKVVEAEHLEPELHQDAKRGPAGLGPDLLRRLISWTTPQVQLAFDFMAEAVDKKAMAAAVIHGIHVQHVAGVEAAVDDARAANVSLISGATEDFLEQVREVLEENEGETADTIRGLLKERAGVSESRATLIARDQTLKLNGKIAEHRQRSAGVEKYRWSTSQDERVRPMHADLEGEVIDWDDPPETNDDGDVNHPGGDYQCRCVPVPVVDELEGEEGADEEEAVGGGQAGDEESEQSIAAEE